jgi:hypothetical protein
LNSAFAKSTSRWVDIEQRICEKHLSMGGH